MNTKHSSVNSPLHYYREAQMFIKLILSDVIFFLLRICFFGEKKKSQ